MVRVTLIEREGRNYIEARWIDPITGKKRTRSTGCTDRRSAERFAARLEQQLEDDENGSPERIEWAEIRTRYFEDAGPFLAETTIRKTKVTLDLFETLIDPRLGSSITTAVVAKFRRLLSTRGIRPYTIRGHLAELSKVLRWAHRQRLLKQVPNVELPRCVEGTKGRPITGEEFERMLAVVPQALATRDPKSQHLRDVPAEEIEQWRFLLRGLWLSGLRVSEAVHLHWTDERQIRVDLSGKLPVLIIQAAAQKNRTHQYLPITPDFAEFLLSVPERQRRGHVFRIDGSRSAGRPLPGWISKMISRIGKRAGVYVSETKTASAHDLRRSFGDRWSERLYPNQLQILMRHKDSKTTQKFYSKRQAQAVASAVANLLRSGNTFGNTDHFEPLPEGAQPQETA